MIKNMPYFRHYIPQIFGKVNDQKRRETLIAKLFLS